jgi:hypothetical protein
MLSIFEADSIATGDARGIDCRVCNLEVQRIKSRDFLRKSSEVKAYYPRGLEQ